MTVFLGEVVALVTDLTGSCKRGVVWKTQHVRSRDSHSQTHAPTEGSGPPALSETNGSALLRKREC